MPLIVDMIFFLSLFRVLCFGVSGTKNDFLNVYCSKHKHKTVSSPKLRN